MNAPAQVLEGVFPDLSESEYFAIPAVSNSRLQPLLRSPAHCKWAMDHPSEPTAAMQLGSAVDCFVFSPTIFNQRFAVAEQCCAITQKKDQCSKMGSMHGRTRKESSGGDVRLTALATFDGVRLLRVASSPKINPPQPTTWRRLF
jgi:hypothetical protein